MPHSVSLAKNNYISNQKPSKFSPKSDLKYQKTSVLCFFNLFPIFAAGTKKRTKALRKLNYLIQIHINELLLV